MAHLSTKSVIRSTATNLVQLFPDVPPVPIEQIIDANHITVLEHALDDNDSGLLVIKNGRPVIVVNKTHHERRRRFTLAHELGHYLLHFDKNEDTFHRDRRSSQGKDRFEIQANDFAAQLLMPEFALTRALMGERLDTFDPIFSSKVEETADIFQVSPQAMSIRLQQLGLLV